MLKTLKNIKFATQPGEGIVGVGGERKARHDKNKLDGSELDGAEVNGNEVEDDEVGKKVQKTSKFKKMVGSLDFLTFKAKLTFTELRQAFLKAPILYHFDLK